MKDVIITPEHPEGLSQTQEKLTLNLYDTGEVLFNFKDGFRLKSSLVSPLYIDLRRLQFFPDAMDDTVSALVEQARGLEYDRVAGVPQAAIPTATLFANRLRKPQITPRMEAKSHGLTRPIDGVYFPGETALVIDDLVTTGGSKFEVINVLRENGLVVRDVVVVFDRQQGAEQMMLDRGLALHSALKIKPTLEFYSRLGRISQDELTRVTNYLANPLLK